QEFGLGMYLVPIESKGFRQVEFKQTMMPDHFEGDLLTGRRKMDPMIRIVGNQTQVVQPLDHVGYGRTAEFEFVRKALGGNWSIIVLQFVDGLEVILHGGGNSLLGELAGG